MLLDGGENDARFGIDIALEAEATRTPPSPRVTVGETVPNDEGYNGACAVSVTREAPGPYWVREDGWWMVRGAQPSLADPVTDFLKVYLSPERESRIAAGEFLEGRIGPGWGCQCVLRFQDTDGDSDAVLATVSIEDISPLIFAPRVKVPRTVGAVKLDGEAWHYFDGEHVFLPNRRGTYRLEIERGAPRAPHVIGTFALVRAAAWDSATFVVHAELPPWVRSVPHGYQFRMGIRWYEGKLVGVAGATVQRPGFRNGGAWAVLRFEAGTARLRFGAGRGAGNVC